MSDRMWTRRALAPAALLAAGWLAAAPASAGPYADAMAKCLVKSTSQADRELVIKFVFVAMAQHPDVQSLAKITPQQREDLSRGAAQLIERLLVESCRTETLESLRFEGASTFVYAFQVFGQAAMSELMTDPSVAGTFKSLGKYMDADQIKSLAAAASAMPRGNGGGGAGGAAPASGGIGAGASAAPDGGAAASGGAAPK